MGHSSVDEETLKNSSSNGSRERFNYRRFVVYDYDSIQDDEETLKNSSSCHGSTKTATKPSFSVNNGQKQWTNIFLKIYSFIYYALAIPPVFIAVIATVPILFPLSLSMVSVYISVLFSCLSIYLFIQFVVMVVGFYLAIVSRIMETIASVTGGFHRCKKWWLSNNPFTLVYLACSPWQAFQVLRCSVDKTKKSMYKRVRSKLPNANVYNGGRASWWFLAWTSVTSILKNKNKVIPAGIERLKKIRNRVQKPVSDIRRNFKKMYKFGDDLFGSIYMKVLGFRNGGKIFIESYSRLPENIVLKMLENELRRDGKFEYIQEWVNKIEIPVRVVDSVRRSSSMYSLVNSQTLSFRREVEDSRSLRSEPVIRRRSQQHYSH